jgi:hypothetical protein
VHRLRGGGIWLIRSRVFESDGLRRRVMHQYRLDKAGLTTLDRIHFELGKDAFVEAARFRVRNGPNLLATPIRLPGRMAPDDEVAAMSGARVRLRWWGRARLCVVGRPSHEHEVICLLASQGKAQRLQWLAAGVGEIALGPADGPLDRWMIRWSGPNGALFGGVPKRFETLPLPPLPTRGDPGLPTERLFE